MAFEVTYSSQGALGVADPVKNYGRVSSPPCPQFCGTEFDERITAPSSAVSLPACESQHPNSPDGLINWTWLTTHNENRPVVLIV